MPMKKVQRKRKAAPRRRQYTGYRGRPTGGRGQSQVFSETYKVSTECAGINSLGEVNIAAGTQGQGIKLVTQFNVLSQAAEYAKLYAAYKIIKAKFTIIPKWRGES